MSNFLLTFSQFLSKLLHVLRVSCITIKHIPEWRSFFQQVNQQRCVPFIPLFYTCWSLSFLQCLFFVGRWGIMRLTGSAWSIPVLHDEQKDLMKTETLILTKNSSFYRTFSCVIREFSCNFVAWRGQTNTTLKIWSM